MNLKKMIVAIFALLTIPSAWTQTAADASKEVDAQITITRGGIDNLIDNMNTKKEDTPFNIEDYLSQTQEFKNKVESILANFENVLEKDILPKAKYLMDQYNFVYASTNYSVEQKQILLPQMKNKATKEFAELTKLYQKSLGDVYALIPNIMVEPRIEVFPKNGTYNIYKDMEQTVTVNYYFGNTKLSSSFNVRLEKVEGTRVRQVVFRNKKTEAGRVLDYFTGVIDSTEKKNHVNINYVTVVQQLSISTDLDNRVYNEINYPLYKGSCKTKMCVGLRTGDYSNLAAMINKMLDRDIKLKLVDGTLLEINRLNKYLYYDFINLTRYDYPEELPFSL